MLFYAFLPSFSRPGFISFGGREGLVTMMMRCAAARLPPAAPRACRFSPRRDALIIFSPLQHGQIAHADDGRRRRFARFARSASAAGHGRAQSFSCAFKADISVISRHGFRVFITPVSLTQRLLLSGFGQLDARDY